MALLGGGDCSFFAHGSCQHAPRLPVAEGVEGLDRAIAVEEGAGFLDQSGRKHLGGSAVEPVIESRARRVEADAQEAEAGEWVAGFFLVSQHLRERFTSREANFNGANQFRRVVGVNALGGGRIEPVEQPMQPAFAVPLAAALQPNSQLLLPLGPGKEALSERTQVEAGAAGDDGQRPRLAISRSAARASRLYSPAVKG